MPAVLYGLGFKFSNNFKNNTEKNDYLNVPSRVSHSTHYKVYPCLSKGFKINHPQLHWSDIDIIY
jgi:hypothetical protein